MVVIRLSRTGAKKRPFYHIVAADKRRARDSKYLERLGYYNPVNQGGETRLEINQDRLQHWIQLGAQPSETVSKLIHESKNPEQAAKKAQAKAEKVAKKAAAAKAKAEAEAKAAADAAAEEAKAAATPAEETKPAEEAKEESGDNA